MLTSDEQTSPPSLVCTCTLCEWVFFPTRVPWGFIYEKLRKFTVSKRSLVVKPRIGTIYIISTFNLYLSIHFQPVVINQLGSTPWHGISFITRHCWPTSPKIVGCYVASVRTPCCMLLRVIGSCYAKYETGQTFSHVQTDATSPNNVGSCWVRLHELPR